MSLSDCLQHVFVEPLTDVTPLTPRESHCHSTLTGPLTGPRTFQASTRFAAWAGLWCFGPGPETVMQLRGNIQWPQGLASKQLFAQVLDVHQRQS